MKQKILVFDTWASSPQVETSLDIAELHKDSGDQVYMVNISPKLPFLEWFPFSNKGTRYEVSTKVKLIKKIAESRGITYSDEIKVDTGKDIAYPEELNTLEKLKNYRIDGIDYGMSVASSLVSFTNELNPSLKEHRGVLEKIFKSSIMAAESFKVWKDLIAPDIVYIRNARTALNRPIFRICKKNKLKVFVHDRAGGVDRYNLFESYMHAREIFTNTILDHWNRSKESENKKIEVGLGFYKQRMAGVGTQSFIENQDKGMLPKDWDPQKINISFFTGSLTEYAAIDHENKADTIFRDQFAAVAEIANFLGPLPEYDFYLRMHPHTKNSYPAEYEQWLRFIEPLKGKMKYIDGDENVDTYQLAKNSDKVIAYMSSVGIEATYFDVPSIVVGNSLYHRLGSNYVPENKNSLFNLLKEKELKPKNKLGAAQYGYFYVTGGTKHKYFKPTSANHGLYRGIPLHVPFKGSIFKGLFFWMYYTFYFYRHYGIITGTKRIFKRLYSSNF